MQAPTFEPAVIPEIARDTSGIGGHPKGLSTLFFTEMWERFSYYGMKAILVLYLTESVAKGGLAYAVARATLIAGFYNMGVYLLSLPGGWVADRFLGARRTVLYGGILIACGHFSMAYPSVMTLYAGMGLIILGTGLLKPNISTMVGALYSRDDERRDAGFSIFYMGINIGAWLAPLICGYLGQRVNWHYGFGAAGVGMTLGLIQYVAGRKRLGNVGARPARRKTAAARAPRAPFTAGEKKQIAVIGILFLFSVIFWMAFEQASTSLNLFSDRLTRNSIFGHEFPSSWFQSVNSMFIIALAPVFSWLWIRLGKRQPSSPAKFALGLLFAGLGFFVITYASSFTSGGRVSPLWLTTVYLLHTIGELCLSPVGLSTVTKLSPARIVGFMMGVWFVSIALGNFAAGWVAGFFQSGSEAALVSLFLKIAFVTSGAAAILILLTPSIRRMMGRVH
jgi:proton-dependent oligopeptide transporter, POT family